MVLVRRQGHPVAAGLCLCRDLCLWAGVVVDGGANKLPKSAAEQGHGGYGAREIHPVDGEWELGDFEMEGVAVGGEVGEVPPLEVSADSGLGVDALVCGFGVVGVVD